jgi:hypothetical protein
MRIVLDRRARTVQIGMTLLSFTVPGQVMEDPAA